MASKTATQPVSNADDPASIWERIDAAGHYWSRCNGSAPNSQTIGLAGSHYQCGLRKSADMTVGYFENRVFLLRTDRFPARRTATGDDGMNPGATGILKITKPAAAKTYRVWLVN